MAAVRYYLLPLLLSVGLCQTASGAESPQVEVTSTGFQADVPLLQTHAAEVSVPLLGVQSSRLYVETNSSDGGLVPTPPSDPATAPSPVLWYKTRWWRATCALWSLWWLWNWLLPRFVYVFASCALWSCHQDIFKKHLLEAKLLSDLKPLLFRMHTWEICFLLEIMWKTGLPPKSSCAHGRCDVIFAALWHSARHHLLESREERLKPPLLGRITCGHTKLLENAKLHWALLLLLLLGFLYLQQSKTSHPAQFWASVLATAAVNYFFLTVVLLSWHSVFPDLSHLCATEHLGQLPCQDGDYNTVPTEDVESARVAERGTELTALASAASSTRATAGSATGATLLPGALSSSMVTAGSAVTTGRSVSGLSSANSGSQIRASSKTLLSTRELRDGTYGVQEQLLVGSSVVLERMLPYQDGGLAQDVENMMKDRLLHKLVSMLKQLDFEFRRLGLHDQKLKEHLAMLSHPERPDGHRWLEIAHQKTVVALLGRKAQMEPQKLAMDYALRARRVDLIEEALQGVLPYLPAELAWLEDPKTGRNGGRLMERIMMKNEASSCGHWAKLRELIVQDKTDGLDFDEAALGHITTCMLQNEDNDAALLVQRCQRILSVLQVVPCPQCKLPMKPYSKQLNLPDWDSVSCSRCGVACCTYEGPYKEQKLFYSCENSRSCPPQHAADLESPLCCQMPSSSSPEATKGPQCQQHLCLECKDEVLNGWRDALVRYGQLQLGRVQTERVVELVEKVQEEQQIVEQKQRAFLFARQDQYRSMLPLFALHPCEALLGLCNRATCCFKKARATCCSQPDFGLEVGRNLVSLCQRGALSKLPEVVLGEESTDKKTRLQALWNFGSHTARLEAEKLSRALAKVKHGLTPKFLRIADCFKSGDNDFWAWIVTVLEKDQRTLSLFAAQKALANFFLEVEAALDSIAQKKAGGSRLTQTLSGKDKLPLRTRLQDFLTSYQQAGDEWNRDLQARPICVVCETNSPTGACCEGHLAGLDAASREKLEGLRAELDKSCKEGFDHKFVALSWWICRELFLKAASYVRVDQRSSLTWRTIQDGRPTLSLEAFTQGFNNSTLSKKIDDTLSKKIDDTQKAKSAKIAKDAVAKKPLKPFLLDDLEALKENLGTFSENGPLLQHLLRAVSVSEKDVLAGLNRVMDKVDFCGSCDSQHRGGLDGCHELAPETVTAATAEKKKNTCARLMQGTEGELEPCDKPIFRWCKKKKSALCEACEEETLAWRSDPGPLYPHDKEALRERLKLIYQKAGVPTLSKLELFELDLAEDRCEVCQEQEFEHRPGGSPRGERKCSKCDKEPEWYCASGCDYQLCDQHKGIGHFMSGLACPKHHPLKCHGRREWEKKIGPGGQLGSVQTLVEWRCDGWEHKSGCRSGRKPEEQSTGLISHRCEVCNYDLCQACVNAPKITSLRTAESAWRKRIAILEGKTLNARVSTLQAEQKALTPKQPIDSELIRLYKEQKRLEEVYPFELEVLALELEELLKAADRVKSWSRAEGWEQDEELAEDAELYSTVEHLWQLTKRMLSRSRLPAGSPRSLGTVPAERSLSRESFRSG